MVWPAFLRKSKWQGYKGDLSPLLQMRDVNFSLHKPVYDFCHYGGKAEDFQAVLQAHKRLSSQQKERPQNIAIWRCIQDMFDWKLGY